jgi:hypothetical protein
MMTVYPTQHSQYNFTDPDKYWPERWDEKLVPAEDKAPTNPTTGCPFHGSAAGNTAANAYMPYLQASRTGVGPAGRGCAVAAPGVAVVRGHSQHAQRRQHAWRRLRRPTALARSAAACPEHEPARWRHDSN